MSSFSNISALQEIVSSLEFFILIVAVTVGVFLAVAVYAQKPKSATNKIFFLLSIATTFWLISAYSIKVSFFADAQLLLTRLAIFFAAPMSALFFLLAYTLPDEKMRLGKNAFYLTVFSTILMMALNISRYAFTGVTVVDGKVSPLAGIGIFPFAFISTLFSVLAVYFLFKKSVGTKTREKQQATFMLVGILLFLALVISTVLVPILLFNSGAFLPLLPAYTLLFLGMTAYAIVKHNLFSIKILVTQAFTLVIWVILFAKIFSAQSAEEKIVGIVVLMSVIIFGIFLIRSVRKEVEQREKIELLASDLKVANDRLKELDQRKSEFVSLASHQLRAPLTAIKGYASLLLEGSFGKLAVKPKEATERIFESSNRLVAIVEDFLTISRIEQNRLEYHFENTDIKKIVSTIFEEMKQTADQKGVALSFVVEGKEKDSFMAYVDIGKISQVVGNVINNAIQYAPKGSIVVSLSKNSSKKIILFTVKDNGIGMTKETIDKLFQKFSRAEDASKTSTTGTGLGLYVASQLAQAQKGRIWAESEGKGKGSTFFVELPSI